MRGRTCNSKWMGPEGGASAAPEEGGSQDEEMMRGEMRKG